MKPGVDYIGVGVGAMIFNEKGKVLLTLRGAKSRNQIGKWEFPGGRVNFGEKLEEAIRREIKEELGIEIEVGDLYYVADDILKEEKQHWVSPAFTCKIKRGVPKILEPGKFEKIGWFSLDNLPSNLSLATKLDIETYKHGRCSHFFTP